jgi:hypothetical protein
VRVGRPAVGWLKRACLSRLLAVDQPYVMLRVAVKGSSASEMVNDDGTNAHGVGSLGAILCRLFD